MIAVIAGSTGLVGSILLKKLLQDEAYTLVISVSRHLIGNNHPKLKEVLIKDLSELPQMADQLKGDVYFCTLGTTIKDAGSQENFRKVDFEAIVNFGKIAEIHQGSLILVSAAGANPESKIFYNRVKGETEKALKSLKLQKLVILRPGLLMGQRKAFRLGEKIATLGMKGFSFMLPKSIEKSASTSVEALAERMMAESKLLSSGIKVIQASEI